MKRLNINLLFSVTLLIIFIISDIEAKAKTSSIEVVPKSAFVEVGKSKKFKATRKGKTIKNVTWFVSVNEELGNGDGNTTSFTLANKNLEENSEMVEVGGIKNTRGIDYSVDYTEGKIEFVNPPDTGVAITAGYFIEGGNATVGTIDGNGLYTAPATIEPVGQKTIDVELKAVSTVNSKKFGKASIKVFSPPIILSLEITPKEVSVVKKKTVTLTLTMKKKGVVDETVKWYVNDIDGGDNTVGRIESSGDKKGIYTAPATIPSDPVTVKAIVSYNTDKNISAKAIITVVKQKKIKLVASGIEPNINFGEVTIGQELINPIQRGFTIATNTGEAVGWQVGKVPTWLNIKPDAGTTPDQVVIEVIEDTSRLNPGVNTDVITFVSGKKGVKSLKLNVFITARPRTEF